LEAALLWAEGDEDDERAADVRDQMRAVDVAIAGHAARLDALPVAHDARLRAANAGISAAMAQVAATEAALDLVLAGPTDGEIAVAEAAVQQATVDLAAAEVALARTRVTAPFAGTLTEVMIEVGDTVAPGQPIAVLGDLDQLRVETTDLTEMDVIAVQADLPVRLTVDALPGQSWTGRVRRIRPERVIVGSDVTYPAIIDLDDPIPGLLWGMTVAVTIGP
jgi:multidrug efflux pump subunit AcrA (membrane-fusion protein)